MISFAQPAPSPRADMSATPVIHRLLDAVNAAEDLSDPWHPFIPATPEGIEFLETSWRRIHRGRAAAAAWLKHQGEPRR